MTKRNDYTAEITDIKFLTGELSLKMLDDGEVPQDIGAGMLVSLRQPIHESDAISVIKQIKEFASSIDHVSTTQNAQDTMAFNLGRIIGTCDRWLHDNRPEKP